MATTSNVSSSNEDDVSCIISFEQVLFSFFFFREKNKTRKKRSDFIIDTVPNLIVQGAALAKEIKAKYCECSAKENLHVDDVIRTAAHAAVKSKTLLKKRWCRIL